MSNSASRLEEAVLRVVPVGPERDRYLPLLSLADDSPEQVRGYYQTGTLFGLDGRDGEAIGMILAIEGLDGVVELKAVAVEPSLHDQGVGTRLLRSVLERLQAGGARRVIVGTSSSGIGQLAYYQKAGFRLWRIERDFFTSERGYPDGIEEYGIPLRDLVWMDHEFG